MTDDAALLATIRAHPADRVRRLVYADWLEDHNDPRHELVRTCERMRELPVFGDDYWRLKARRNELCPACPADWLAATGYDDSDYDPVFRSGWPDDWRGRWRVIREFTERWHGIPMPDVGGRLAEIAAEEARLGLTLPASVREYVAYAFDVSPAPDRRGVHGDVYTMRPVPFYPSALSLAAWYEGDMHRAVRLADLHLADPPLGVFFEDDDLGAEPADERVTDVVLGLATRPTWFSDSFESHIQNADQLRRLLGEAFAFRWSSRPGWDHYEHEAGVLAMSFPSRFSGPGVVLNVGVRRGVDPDAVPTLLWEYAATARMRRGLFVPPGHTDDGADIPF